MNQKILPVLPWLLLATLSPALSFAATEPSAAPAPSVTGPLATNYFDLEVNYTKPADAEGVLVVARQASAPIKTPIDTTEYTADARFGVGDTLVPGCILYCDYVVSDDTALSGSVTVTGLKSGITYYFAAYSYNGTGTDINYNQTITAISATTANVPPEGMSHNELYVATGPGGTETNSDCANCHGVHHTSQLLPSGSDQLDKCQSCHRAGGPASAKTDIGLHPADDSVDCGTCHSMHSFRKEELYSTNHAGEKGFNKSFVRANMSKCMNPTDYPPPGGGGTLTALDNTVFQDRPTDFAFASEDPARPGIFNGVCQSCHLATDVNHYTQTGADGHHTGEDCIVCHKHSDKFMHGGGGTGCFVCHGHDAGSSYDSDMTFPNDGADGTSPGYGSAQSHSTHTETTGDDLKGPGIYCDTCHNISNFPYFKSGTDANGDGLFSLSETDVCDDCHSGGGTYDGLDDPAIGAKEIWKIGAYAATDDSTLRSDKEKWCATCHDESASVIAGVTAPNVIGDEDGPYVYGTGWGYYKTGHGLTRGVYPASGAPGANQACSGCHDFTASHIDGTHRTYLAASDNYQSGYRLKYGMDIPRTDVGQPVSDFALCFSCHDSDLYINSTNLTTNFRQDVTRNSHYLHLQAPSTGQFAGSGWWDSDWDGAIGDSKFSCPACHNVHGSPSPRMMRFGELISSPGTTDKVPALNFKYTPASSYPTLMASTGGVLNPPSSGGGSIGNSGVCSMCHSNQEGYTRTPNDMYLPEIINVYGNVGSNILSIVFSEGVYTDAGATGALSTADFAYTDSDNGRTVTGITHAAGETFVLLTLSAPLDSTDDIDVDTLAAATAASIYDAASQAMDTTQVVVAGDAEAPALSSMSPAKGATEIAVNSNLTFTLSDSGGGVDWSTFQIQLSGNMGYAKTYTDLDSAVVAKTGDISGYTVTVNPDLNFSNNEIITVTVNVSDYVGNALIPPVWSFTTQVVSTPQTMTIHPSGLAAEGSGGFAPTGGTWADVLDSDDSDITYVSVCCQGFGTFYVDMDDPDLGGATISSVTVKVVVRNSPSSYNVNMGFKTGTATVWKGNTSVGTSYTTLTMDAPTNSDGGVWSLTDLNNLRVAVLRNYTGSPRCYATEVSVEINYTP